MGRQICVYSSSSETIAKPYFAAADALGRALAERGHTLIFGAGTIGLMGAMARAAKAAGGAIIGVIPEKLNLAGIVYEHCDELIVTRDMRERKRIMEDRAEAFIALPGGFGTLEELLEIITLKQLHYHEKAVAMLNTKGFYNALLGMFDQLFRQNFVKPEYRQLYFAANTAEEVLDHIDSYTPRALGEKWH